MNSRAERDKHLRTVVPFGYLTTRQALRSDGFTTHQIDNLLKLETLVAVAPGVYQLPDTVMSWEGLVASLQRVGVKVTVGGYTALQMAGFEHYLSLGTGVRVTLFSAKPLPPWSLTAISDVTIEQARYSKLFRQYPVEGDLWQALTTKRQPNIPVRTSRPELAWLEALHGVPQRLSFEHADNLSESLSTLSPTRLQVALELCSNVKVKRLFFWFASRHQHAWSKTFDHTKFDLGTGKREIARPGRLDKTFLITVPESLHGPA